MLNQSSSSSYLPLWRRVAVFLSFVAVLSALIAPASMLAEDVRTGKLGGVCLVKTADASVEAMPAGTHCDLCGSFALDLPAFVKQAMPCQPGQNVACSAPPFNLAALVEGLPPSRGPPVL